MTILKKFKHEKKVPLEEIPQPDMLSSSNVIENSYSMLPIGMTFQN